MIDSSHTNIDLNTKAISSHDAPRNCRSLWVNGFRIGFTDVQYDGRKNKCFWPPRIWFDDEFLDNLSQQLFSVRHRHVLDQRTPGWVYGFKEVPAKEVNLGNPHRNIGTDATLTMVDDTKIIYFENHSAYGCPKEEYVWTLVDMYTHPEYCYAHKLGVWRD